jgi:hypothetical protein
MDAGMTVLYGIGIDVSGSVEQLGRFYKSRKTKAISHIQETAVIEIE